MNKTRRQTPDAYMQGDVHNAQSNADFDVSLTERNPAWGVRDNDELKGVGKASGLSLREIVEMPSNNTIIVFCSGNA